MASALDRFAQAYQNAYNAQIAQRQREAELLLAERARQVQNDINNRTLDLKARDLDSLIAARTAQVRASDAATARAQDEADYRRLLRFTPDQIGQIKRTRDTTISSAALAQQAQQFGWLDRLAQLSPNMANLASEEMGLKRRYTQTADGIAVEDSGMNAMLLPSPSFRKTPEQKTEAEKMLEQLANLLLKKRLEEFNAGVTSGAPVSPSSAWGDGARMPRNEETKAREILESLPYNPGGALSPEFGLP